jgi:SAM-dependent methyltransferase
MHPAMEHYCQRVQLREDAIRAKRSRRNVVDFHTADSELITTLENLDDAGNYASWIIDQIEPFLGSAILEIGAGHGTFTDRLRHHGHVVASEPSPRAAARLRERFAGDDRVTVDEAFAQAIAMQRSFDTAVSINVMEHIDDDQAVVDALGQAIAPGGRLIIFVPAFECLYSRFDRDIGHVRRYQRRELETMVTRGGFDVELLRYVNMPGAVAWFVMCRVLRLRPTQRWSTRLYDRMAIPVVRRVESRFKPPFGQSLLCVARKPSGSGSDAASASPASASASPASASASPASARGARFRRLRFAELASGGSGSRSSLPAAQVRGAHFRRLRFAELASGGSGSRSSLPAAQD